MSFANRLRSFLFLRSAPALFRFVVQAGFALFFAYVGMLFYRYALWAMGESEVYAPRPPSAEAFLPISALISLKRLILTGEYDLVHPAGLTILLLALFTALFLRKSFCGWLCPVGFLSVRLDRLGRALGISKTPPKWLSILLSAPKYLLLAFFGNLLLVQMSVADIEGFLATPYNQIADTKMLLFFLEPGTTLLVILGVLLLGGMIVPSFWCRGFCPYGALLGLVSFFSPVAVRRDKDLCTGCRRCTKVCPSRIAVHEKLRVADPECTGCTECVGACPEPNCLALRAGFGKSAPRLPYWAVGAASLAAVYLFFAWASMADRWTAPAPPRNMIRELHRDIRGMGHP